MEMSFFGGTILTLSQELNSLLDIATGPWMFPFQTLTTFVITVQNQSSLLDFIFLEAGTSTQRALKEYFSFAQY